MEYLVFKNMWRINPNSTIIKNNTIRTSIDNSSSKRMGIKGAKSVMNIKLNNPIEILE